MTNREIVRRLRAFHEGTPVPSGETKHFAVVPDEDILVVSFVRMGGESRPWGIAFGHPGRPPQVLVAPDGRNRDEVTAIVAEFTPALLRHLQISSHTAPTPVDAESLAPLRQVWLPNPSHVEMLHHLNYAYAFTRSGGDGQDTLNALGRAAGWLFREAQRPGQQHVMAATDILRASYSFPAEDIRQGHLGFLLVWLLTTGDRDAKIAAAESAERHSISTSLDPAIERDKLESAVLQWQAARRSGDAPGMAAAKKRVETVLARELSRRFDLVCSAIGVLRDDRRRTNAGVDRLVRTGLEEQWYRLVNRELKAATLGYVPGTSPETDKNPVEAAAAYLRHLAAQDRWVAALVHDDAELLAEQVASGDAFTGMIMDVDDLGVGRATRPVWRIRDVRPGPLRLREGSRVAVVGLPTRTAEIRAIEEEPGGSRIFKIEITGCKTRPRGPGGALVPLANDTSLEGRHVAFVGDSAEQLIERKARRIWDGSGPGMWLTHARPSGSRTRIASESREEADAS